MPKSTLTLYGTLTAAETETRILRYMLLPYGEYGRTSAGLVKAEAGALELPALDGLQFNLQHDRWKPIGRFIELAETEAGLTCAVRVSQTTAGNDLLVEAADGLRTGISVEIAEAVIDDQGNLASGQLVGAGAVVDPAFPSAQLAAALNYTSTEGEPVPRSRLIADPLTPENTSKVQASLEAAAASATGGQTLTAQVTEPVQSFPQLLATAIRENDHSFLMQASGQVQGDALFAALANVPLEKNDHQHQYIGELWKARPSYGVLTPLFAGEELADFWIEGFDNPITNELRMQDYAGDPDEIGTITAPTITPFQEEAKHAAVGFNYSRKYVDFRRTAYIEAFIQSGLDYWENYMDLKLAQRMNATKTTLVANAPRADVDPVQTEIISGTMELRRRGGNADFAILGSSKYYDLATEKDRDKLVDPHKFFPTQIVDGRSFVPADAVIIGDSRSIRYWELGSGPIRVNALALATGQVQEALFGYWWTKTQDPRALIDVKPYTATP